jgi:hypothetical protein
MRRLLDVTASIEHGVRFGPQDTKFLFGIDGNLATSAFAQFDQMSLFM